MTLYREWLNKIQENDRQKAAFEKNGHTVVIAGPGSGKTRVLAIKIAKLLRDEIPQPKGVACLTYTRMMAMELENRLSSLNVLDRPNIVIGTVHSFCLQQIVNPFSEIFGVDIPQPVKIAPLSIWNECLNLARESVTGLKFNPDTDNSFKTNLTKYHLQRIDRAYDLWENQEFARIIQQLHANLQINGYVDFDIVIGIAIDLLANYDLVRQALFAKFAWLAVDEYQDLGYPLFRIVDLLLENTSIKLFAIGDPDQSIFDFAGTDPQYLINLTERPEVQPVIKLNKNYRSTTEVIQIAKSIVNPYCAYDSEKKGGMIRIYESSLSDQGEKAAWLVRKCLSLGVKAERIAVLHPWRGKDGSEGINLIAKHFTNIKFTLDKNPFYDRSKMIISWLEDLAYWCLDGLDATSDKRDDKSFESLITTWFQITQTQFGTKIDIDARLKLIDFIWTFRGQDLSLWAWLDRISDNLKLDVSLTHYEKIFPDEVAEFRNLRKVTRPGCELETWTLREFLDMSRGVQLTTIHSSKGMEFEVVIITGVERIWNDDNGKRLLYVAVTRAERDVCLIYSKVWPEWNPATPAHIANIRKNCGELPFVKQFSI